jgi:hypothetical protein
MRLTRKTSGLRGSHEVPMAQVNALIAGLSTRDSSLQISSCPKQEDLAVPVLLSDRKKVVDVICRPRTCKRRLTGSDSVNPKDHKALEFTFTTRR